MVRRPAPGRQTLHLEWAFAKENSTQKSISQGNELRCTYNWLALRFILLPLAVWMCLVVGSLRSAVGSSMYFVVVSKCCPVGCSLYFVVASNCTCHPAVGNFRFGSELRMCSGFGCWRLQNTKMHKTENMKTHSCKLHTPLCCWKFTIRCCHELECDVFESFRSGCIEKQFCPSTVWQSVCSRGTYSRSVVVQASFIASKQHWRCSVRSRWLALAVLVCIIFARPILKIITVHRFQIQFADADVWKFYTFILVMSLLGSYNFQFGYLNYHVPN